MQDYPTFDFRRAAATAALLRRNSVRADDPSRRTVDPSERQYPVFRPPQGGELLSEVEKPNPSERRYPVFNPPSPSAVASATHSTGQSEGYDLEGDGGQADSPPQYPRYLASGAAHEAAHAATPPAPDSTATERQYPVFRPPSQVEADETALRDLVSSQPDNTNSRGAGALRLAAYQASQEARQTDSLGRVAGAAAGGLISGLVNKRVDEAVIDRPQQIRRAQQRLATDEDALRQEGVEADIAYKRARPGLEQAKADSQARVRAQAGLQREIANRQREPRPFDVNDAYDFDLLQRARSNGVSFDPQGFGDTKNPVTMEVIDPSDPSGTRKTRLQYDREKGEWTPVTVVGQRVQTGYTQPVGADGMTAAERQSAKDREAAEAHREQQRTIQNEFAQRRINLSAGHLSLAQAAQDNRLSEQSRRELKAANDLAAQAERYQQAANDIGSRTQYTDPNDGQVKESRRAANQRDLFAGRAAALRQQLVSDYGYLFDADGTGAKMTTDKFKGLFPSLQGNWSGEAQRLGVALIDDPAQGPIRQSPMPRRTAPARGAQTPSQPSTPRVSRAKFRAKYPQFNGQPDSAVDAAISSSGGQPIP